MLRGLYSELSPFSRLFLLITLVLSFMLFSALFGILILVPFYGSGILGILSSPDYSNATVITSLKVIQICNMAGGLLMPALLYLWLCTPKEEKYTAFSLKISPLLVVSAIILTVVSQPFIGWTSELNSYLSLPDWLAPVEGWMKGKEKLGADITDAFLATTTAGGLTVNLFMIVVLPAFAEEVLFRGVLAKSFRDWTKSIHFAVLISAFIFAAIHLQFYGFLPRFLLGVALGYLFFWSGSLWLPIAAHFTNNFLSVMVEFLYRKGIIHTNAENFGMNNPLLITGFSLLALSAILYMIYRITRQKSRA
jgi:uncharacterized protein